MLQQELVNPRAEDYSKQFSSPHDTLLQEILNETHSVHRHAHMISGSVQGKLLEMVSCMIKPQRVLEIGTFTGFSALCLAAGLQVQGIIHTIELRNSDAEVAQKYFDKSSFKNQIRLHIGDAKEIISQLDEEWDLVFIDADKLNYIDYYELTLPKVKRGGFILADNVLFHGDVLRENIVGKNAIAIHAFNEHIKADKRTEQIMLTVRDGISLIRKL